MFNKLIIINFAKNHIQISARINKLNETICEKPETNLKH